MPRANRHLLPGYIWNIQGVRYLLLLLFGYDSLQEFQKHHKIWIDGAVKNNRLERDSKWSERIAVGRKSFVESVNKKLGYKVKGRKVTRLEESYLISEPVDSYNPLFEGKNIPRRVVNRYLWDLNL